MFFVASMVIYKRQPASLILHHSGSTAFCLPVPRLCFPSAPAAACSISLVASNFVADSLLRSVMILFFDSGRVFPCVEACSYCKFVDSFRANALLLVKWLCPHVAMVEHACYGFCLGTVVSFGCWCAGWCSPALLLGSIDRPFSCNCSTGCDPFVPSCTEWSLFCCSAGSLM